MLAIPTPKANTIVKVNAYNKIGSLKIVLKNLIGPFLVIANNENSNKPKFSIADKTIAGLPISVIEGLYIAVKIAIGANLISPEKVPSSFPIL